MTATGAATLEHVLGTTGTVSLRLPSGTVRVVGTEGDRVRVRDLDGRPVEGRFKVETGTGTFGLSSARNGIGLVIAVGDRGWGLGNRANLEVEMPAGAALVLDTASADVRIAGVRGGIRLKTASGDAVLEAVAGALVVDAVSGDVHVTADADVALDARTISGDLSLTAPTVSRLRATTTSGDLRIDAEPRPGGDYAVESISGDATVFARSGVVVEAKTISGDIEAEGRVLAETLPGRRRLTVGGGGPTLSFRSVSGDLRIREPRTPRPVAAPAASAAPGSPVAGPAVAGPAVAADRADERMEVLRAVERGDLDVDAAMVRLAELEVAAR
jgi:hypothetical protein